MRTWLGALAIIGLLAAALWFAGPDEPVAAAHAAADDRPSLTGPRKEQPDFGDPAGPPDTQPQPGESSQATEAAPPPPKPVSLASLAEPPLGPEISAGLAPTTAMENVRATFRNYSSRFGGNPVGTNEEITRALKGANPGKTPFLDTEDGLEVNDRGELVDNWGTPYFFHQLSRTEIEIYSAGPDRKLWTSDDLRLK
jgi:hypothetical protein